MKVLLAPSTFGDPDDAPLKKLREAGLEVIENPYRRRLSKAELGELLAGVDGVIAGLEPYDRDVLEGSVLKVISRCGSGMSNVDILAAAELGIAVFGTPEAPVEAVAELTVGALLALARQTAAMDRAMHERRWDKRVGRQLDCMTVAIVGYGRIGRRVATLLRAFGADIIAVDPHVTSGGDVPILPLDAAISRADAVTLHSSGDSVLIGDRELALMKPGALLLNAGRGGLVDHDALERALEKGRLGGAWLDAFEQEPYEGPLCDRPEVLLTPHVGSYTAECRRAMEMQAVENLLSVLGDEKMATDELDGMLVLAERAAREAAAWAPEAGRGVRLEQAHDLKLEADVEMQARATPAIAAESAWPILAEEDADATLSTASGKVWVIDPLDGTVNFSRGIPLSCVSVALLQDGEPILGVVYDFHRDELFSFQAGLGAHVNGSPIHVSGVFEPAGSVICTGFPAATDYSDEALVPFVRRVQRFGKVRLIGSAALSLAWVAAGRADYYEERAIRLWDVAAGVGLVREAGGVAHMVAVAGEAHTFDVSAGNAALVERTL